MNILILGGTRFFGRHLVRTLLKDGHNVTIATRGRALDSFGSQVKRTVVERTSPESLRLALHNTHYDVIYDNLAYCSNDVKYLLDTADCDRYIMTSSASVYDLNPEVCLKIHSGIREEEFDPLQKELLWCSRADFPYDEVKRQAECALFQKYPQIPSIAVRFPFVIGDDDYTKRLFFYVEHIANEKTAFIDNFDSQLPFVRSDEAGAFLASLAASDCCGPINGCSEGTMSIHDLSNYMKQKTGKSMVLSAQGDPGPYNGTPEYSLNTDKARKTGFHFTPLKEWIYDLIGRMNQ